MRDHTPKPGEVQQLKELLPALIKMLDGYVEATHPVDLVGAEQS